MNQCIPQTALWEFVQSLRVMLGIGEPDSLGKCQREPKVEGAKNVASRGSNAYHWLH